MVPIGSSRLRVWVTSTSRFAYLANLGSSTPPPAQKLLAVARLGVHDPSTNRQVRCAHRWRTPKQVPFRVLRSGLTDPSTLRCVANRIREVRWSPSRRAVKTMTNAIWLPRDRRSRGISFERVGRPTDAPKELFRQSASVTSTDACSQQTYGRGDTHRKRTGFGTRPPGLGLRPTVSNHASCGWDTGKEIPSCGLHLLTGNRTPPTLLEKAAGYVATSSRRSCSWTFPIGRAYRRWEARQTTAVRSSSGIAGGNVIIENGGLGRPSQSSRA